MLTPTVRPTPPQIPSSLPPSIPHVPPSFPPSVPSSVPFSSPPPLPVVAPPVIPMTPPPLPPLPFNSPPLAPPAPPTIPISAPPSLPFSPPIPITAAPPPVPPPQPDLDMDDFMSSFSKSATSTAPISYPVSSVSQPTQNAAPKRASYSDKPNAKKTGIPPPKSSQGSRAPVSGMDDLFGNLTISQSSSPSNNSGIGSGGYNTNPPSLEEQFRKNQEEINRLQQMQQLPSSQPPMPQFPQQQFGNYPLSGPPSVPQSNPGMMFGGQPAASGSMNFGVPAATAAVNNNMSYGNNQPQYGAPFGTPNPGPYGGGFNSSPMQPSLPSPQPQLFPQNNGQLPQQFPQQQQQQQGYGGYGGQPQYSNQTNYGYSSTPVPYSNPPYSGGGGAPNSGGGGYRPP